MCGSNIIMNSIIENLQGVKMIADEFFYVICEIDDITEETLVNHNLNLGEGLMVESYKSKTEMFINSFIRHMLTDKG